jgi:nucleotide-binding universal stress UspA family protein
VHTILIAFDGSDHARRAVELVVTLHREHGGIRVQLVNVEPAPVEWQTHGMEREATEAQLRALGERKLQPARALLEKAGVPHEARVILGEPAHAIAGSAKDLACDGIVMGTRGLGSVAGLLMGSVATKVLHLTELPVTLVK